MPSSVSRSPVTVSPSTLSDRSDVRCGSSRNSAIIDGTAPTRPSVASLPAMTSSTPSTVPSAGQDVGGLDRVGAVQGIVLDVDSLVGTHRQCFADRVGGARGSGGQHCDLAAVGLFDLQSGFDGFLVDLVDHRINGAIQREVVGELALRNRCREPA